MKFSEKKDIKNLLSEIHGVKTSKLRFFRGFFYATKFRKTQREIEELLLKTINTLQRF